MFLERAAKLAAPLRAKLRGREILPVIVQARRSEGDGVRSLVESAFDVGASRLGLDFVSAILPRDAVLALAGDEGVLRVYLDRTVSIPEATHADPFSLVRLAREVLPRGPLGVRPREVRDRIAARMDAWNPTSATRRFVGAHLAQEVGVDGRGVLIAVVDTDASPRFANHPQLRGKTETYTVRGPVATDTNGHGGHVACIAAGRRATSPLGIEVEGVAPGARVLGVKALYTPIGSGMESDVIRAMSVAVDRGARVVNLSLGSSPVGGPEDDAESQAIRQLSDRAVFVAASGNDGPDPGSVDSPAWSSDAIAVGALDPRTGELADFSSRGPAPGGTKPDFAAPGVEVYSGLTRRTYMDRIGDLVSEGYGPISGTSQATPHVAGVVALAMQVLERDLGVRVTADVLRDIGERLGHPKTNADGYGPLTWPMVARYAGL